ncbi:unnamed protein product [Onchocerca ochengi]|uniref:CUB domain-containing protein n=1 Tax=Onchocerca ochengi TaxID=42157 RepID=A0A182EFR5_ONCOC|nr:unnamed protein product [Onchocerca ochengi]
MEHASYSSTWYSKSDCVIVFKFLDEQEYEIIRFTIIPGQAEYQLTCAGQHTDYAKFVDNTLDKNYEFELIFSSVGIMLFNMDRFYIKSTHCIHRIPHITKFIHTATGTFGFEAKLIERPLNFRIPDNWIISKPLPMNHKIIINYYPDVQSVITIRLLDKNQKELFVVIIDDKEHELEARNMILEPWKTACITRYKQQLITLSLNRIEISMYTDRFQIILRAPTDEDMKDTLECIAYNHIINPDDIQFITFDSTNKNAVLYSYFIKPIRAYI